MIFGYDFPHLYFTGYEHKQHKEIKLRTIRHELDKFKVDAVKRARIGLCEGSCVEHTGDVKAVRVFNKDSGIDWGYFSYCAEARKEEIENRGMELEYI